MQSDATCRRKLHVLYGVMGCFEMTDATANQDGASPITQVSIRQLARTSDGEACECQRRGDNWNACAQCGHHATVGVYESCPARPRCVSAPLRSRAILCAVDSKNQNLERLRERAKS